MASLEALRGLDEYFLTKPDDFKPIFDSPYAHKEPMPDPWN